MADENRPKKFLHSRTGIALIAFFAIGAYFLWAEHRAHVASAVPYLPYLLFLLCPLLHLFHHGHGGGDHKGGHSDHDRGGERR